MQPVSNVAKKAVHSARNPSSDTSFVREGINAPNPPTKIPTLLTGCIAGVLSAF
jgi:hypothetical protein